MSSAGITNNVRRKKKDMKFKINNREWTIEEVDEATINNEMKNDGTLCRE